MKNKTITITIAITLLALLGVIVTQLFWVKSAVDSRQEQFDQEIQLGLKRVVNQLMSLQNDTAISSQFVSTRQLGTIHEQFIRTIDPHLIDSMMHTEFATLYRDQQFYYGIFNNSSHDFVLTNDKSGEPLLLQSDHHVPISCIFQKEQYTLSVYFPHEHRYVFNRMLLYILLSSLFTLVITGSFWFIISLLLRQKKLSEIKTDFVNNMTHEFKTPISTVSVASEMLMKDGVRNSPAKTLRYARIIYDENARLKNQVEQVLQVAILDRHDYKLRLRQVDVHEVLEQVIKSFNLPLKKRNGRLRKRFNAANSLIVADRSHLANVFHNLLDNANKYSPAQPEIVVSTTSGRRGIKITVEDSGIGMAEDQIRHIFKKFHRIPTGDIHDVKGFGIGLFYVKTIVEAHGGTIKANSKLGKGSIFTLFFPYRVNDPAPEDEE